ncbi:hypothetical protein H6G36_02130 [Anabaena minutissima FACHB-250]|nr:hypothetical protein [Anabaena minutissima FACHB-250]
MAKFSTDTFVDASDRFILNHGVREKKFSSLVVVFFGEVSSFQENYC